MNLFRAREERKKTHVCEMNLAPILHYQIGISHSSLSYTSPSLSSSSSISTIKYDFIIKFDLTDYIVFLFH